MQIKLLEEIRQKKKRKLFEEQLADSLDLFANGLRAGLTFMQAFALIAEEGSPPINEEIKQIVSENTLGVPLEESFQKINERMKSADLKLCLTAILVTRQTGGNLAEIVSKIAKTIRERQKIREQIKTLTSQGRLSGLIIGCLPFLLLIGMGIIDSSFVIPMFTTFGGILIIATALFLELLGAFFIAKIVNIEI